MENNLQTALSQIKRPVRYDEKTGCVIDARHFKVVKVLLECLGTIENTTIVGHALAECINRFPDVAEMINGMGDGVKLQDAETKKLLDLQIDKCASVACHLVTFENNEITPPDMFNEVLGTPYVEFKAPAREVRSAEEILNEIVPLSCMGDKKKIIQAMQEYANQFK